MAQINNL